MAVEFHGPEWVSGATGIFVAGVGLLAAIRWRGDERFPEPATSIGALLTYAPIAYATSYLPLIPGAESPVRFAVVFLMLAALHAQHLWLRWRAARRTPKTLLKQRLVPSHSIHHSAVSTSKDAVEYRQTIVALELGARRLDRIPKRLSVVFKSGDAVRSIAAQRFGPGSDSARAYVEEHDERARQFFQSLSAGCSYREIYSRSELMEYVATRRHGKRAQLSVQQMREGLEKWIHTIQMYPSYQVAITDEKLPFKYELVDQRILVLHEALGENDRGRVNALVLEDQKVARDFQVDFNSVWERVEPADREAQRTIAWITTTLIAQLEQTEDANGARSLG